VAADRMTVAPFHRHPGTAGFHCGTQQLDDYLRTLAGQQHRKGIARVFLAEDADSHDLVGYDSMSSYLVQAESLGQDGRRLPRLAPATLLGRLAVDVRWQGLGVGAELLTHALARALDASRQVASLAVIVDTIDARAASFYEAHGFRRFADEPGRLFLPMQAIDGEV